MSPKIRSLVPILRDVLFVAVATALALALAYQVRSRVMIDVGGIRDDFFARHFYNGESDGTQTFRWTQESSQLELFGEPLTAPWTLRMRVNGYRPEPPAGLTVSVNGVPVADLEPVGDWRVYTVPGDMAGDPWEGNITLALTNDTFVPQEYDSANPDARELGVAVDWVEWVPEKSEAAIGAADRWIDFGQLPVVPPLAYVLRWALAMGILYATVRGIGVAARPSNILFAVVIALLAVGVAFVRPFITHWTFAFLNLALVLAVLAVGLRFFIPRIGRRLALTVDARHGTVLCAIVLLSIGLKWGGVWYPQFQSSDLTFHVHRLEFINEARLFFTSELPDEARRVVPYPPALYVVLEPISLWTNEYPALILFANILADAVAILALYFAARRVMQGAGTEAGPASTDSAEQQSQSSFPLYAAFLFAFNPVTFWIYSWGNHTNIFGEMAATLLFCVLLTQSMTKVRGFVLALFFLLLAATAHLGIFLSLLVFFLLLIVIELAERGAFTRREKLAVILLAAAGIGLAWLVYYGEFGELLLAQTQQYIQDFSSGRAGTGEPVSLARVGNVGLYSAEQVGWVLLLCGIGGFPLAWKGFTARARAVWLAWLLVAAFFMLVTIGSTFSARYTLWAAPALALSGGLLLAWLGEKSRVAQFAAYGVCAVALAATAWSWIDLVLNAYQ